MPRPPDDYLYLATQVILADGRTSFYVSANSEPIPIQDMTMPAGRVSNNFFLSKSGSNINFSWSTLGGTCFVEYFNMYSGTLPFLGYNHAPFACGIWALNYSAPLPPDSYYYLVVPANSPIAYTAESSEGIYGNDSSGNQIPQMPGACDVQDYSICN